MKKLGLALGSGGAKGLAHIGLLKVLEAEGIPVSMVAGASIGALIGGLYASWMDADRIETLARAFDWRQAFSLLDPTLGNGLVRGERVRQFIEEHVGGKQFSELLLPFATTAVDLRSGDLVVFRQGGVTLAIRASTSFPLVFQPVAWQGRLLADGGLGAPVPVDQVRELGAEVVLAVNLDAQRFANTEKTGRLSMRHIVDNSINALRMHLAEENCRRADLVIVPQTGVIGWEKFFEPGDLIEVGVRAGRKILPQLKALLAETS
ncbi:MAG: patatin-like phospholipase family protein [Coprothermobacterota bacterium]|nr:patatin-like phospholipase family protein [Coprothermobacterota bacterium]